MPPSEFDKIIAKLLKKENYRAKVCPNPEKEIGTALWKTFSQAEKNAIQKIACEYDGITYPLDDALRGTDKDSSYFVTDW